MRTFRQVEWNADKLGRMQPSRVEYRQVGGNAAKLNEMLSSKSNCSQVE